MELRPITVEELMKQFAALSNLTRWNILRFLGRAPDGLVVTALSQVLNVDDALISNHCAKLVAVGLLDRTTSGRYTIHKIKGDAVRRMIDSLLSLEGKPYEDIGSNGSTSKDHPSQSIGERENSTSDNAG